MSIPNKKKPGRPRKMATAPSEAATVATATVEEAVPVVVPESNGHPVAATVEQPKPQFPMLPEKVKILVASLSYNGWVRQEMIGFVSGMFEQMREHPRLGELRVATSSGYPCDRVRNDLCKKAVENGFHFLLMLDNDMKFDCLLGRDPQARPFLPTAFDFLVNRKEPAVIGAPYTGGPPEQRVMVMRWRDSTPDLTLGEGMKLESFTREEAAERTGIERVAGLPTGCLLIDLRCLQALPPPWFAYEFGDPPFNTVLASTEDIVFTRNLDWVGIEQYVAWDSWCGHIKEFTTGKPRVVNPNDVPRAIWKVAKAGKVPPQYDW